MDIESSLSISTNFSFLLSWTDEIPYRYINFMFHALNFIIWKKIALCFLGAIDAVFFNQRDFVSAKYLILPVHSTDEIKLSSFKLYNFRKKKKSHSVSLALSLWASIYSSKSERFCFSFILCLVIVFIIVAAILDHAISILTFGVSETIFWLDKNDLLRQKHLNWFQLYVSTTEETFTNI